jgi:hypothetical protein
VDRRGPDPRGPHAQPLDALGPDARSAGHHGAADDGGAAFEAARAHLAAIAAEPRPAGGPAEARARAYAAGVLEAAGYRVREAPFTYSAAVGRFGAPAAGGASLAVLLAAAVAGVRDRPAAAGGTLMLALLALAALAGWAARSGVRRLPVLRREAVNLVAEPPAPDGGEPPQVWLVAHLDSKSQPVAMALRVAGVSALVAAWVSALALAAVHGSGWVDASRAQRLWPGRGAARRGRGGAGDDGARRGALGGRARQRVGRGVGAAGRQELAESGAVHEDGTPARRAPVGVLLTSAEELALAGAHAWAAAWYAAGASRAWRSTATAWTTTGPLRLLGSGDALFGLRNAARNAVPDARVRALPPGVLVDAVALAQAGWSAVTVSKGTWRTLGRVHTRRDTLARLDGRGVPEAAGALARLARLLAAGRVD